MDRRTIAIAILCALCISLPLRPEIDVNAAKGENMKLMAASPVTEINLQDSAVPFYSYQWALKNDGRLRGRYSSASGPGLAAKDAVTVEGVEGIDIHIEPAWEVYTQAAYRRPVTVALIDTGVDVGHPELQDAIWINGDEIPGDGIDNDRNGFVDDVNGWNFYTNRPQVFDGADDDHGTHAAGTIAGKWDGRGITGIADSSYVKIMVLKALGSERGRGSSTAVKDAIRYAEQNGADICNLSMGATEYDEELETLIRDSRMLFVVSAGNGGEAGQGYDIDRTPAYPASYPSENIITVANLLFDGSLAANSNFGAASVDIAAPGSLILSTLPNHGFGFMSGTSMAAPMVTGTAALIYSCRPDLSLLDVRRVILDSARKIDGLNGRVATGGILDAYAAIMQ